MSTEHGGGETGAHVALLRGVNVGGRNRLPMSALADVFVEAGCSKVRTYIQSGNVVFRASDVLAGQLPSLVSEHIARRFGLRVPVVMRSAADLEEVVHANPYLQQGAPEAALHVAFLATRPGEAHIAPLDPDRSPPDRFTVRGREIYLFCPQGLARTRLTNDYFDATLGTTSTIRNWRTVVKLLEMAGG